MEKVKSIGFVVSLMLLILAVAMIFCLQEDCLQSRLEIATRTTAPILLNPTKSSPSRFGTPLPTAATAA